MKFYSVENEQPTERTLRQEANRLEHLRAKAAKQKKYSPASWFSVIFSYRGRAAHHIRHPLAWVLLVSVVAALVSTSHGTRKWTAWLKRVEAAEALLRMALSFLLVFRLGRSATRYWEARQKAGAMIEVCRTLASTALAHMVVGGDLDRVEHRLRWPASPRAARDEAKDEPWMSTSCSPPSAVCRWVVVFPVAAKNYLRADPGDAADLEGLLSGPEVAALFAAPCQPLFVLDTMRCLVVAWASDAVAAGGRPELVAMSLQALNSNIDRLTSTFGGADARVRRVPRTSETPVASQAWSASTTRRCPSSTSRTSARSSSSTSRWCPSSSRPSGSGRRR